MQPVTPQRSLGLFKTPGESARRAGPEGPETSESDFGEALAAEQAPKARASKDAQRPEAPSESKQPTEKPEAPVKDGEPDSTLPPVETQTPTPTPVVVASIDLDGAASPMPLGSDAPGLVTAAPKVEEGLLGSDSLTKAPAAEGTKPEAVAAPVVTARPLADAAAAPQGETAAANADTGSEAPDTTLAPATKAPSDAPAGNAVTGEAAAPEVTAKAGATPATTPPAAEAAVKPQTPPPSEDAAAKTQPPVESGKHIEARVVEGLQPKKPVLEAAEVPTVTAKPVPAAGLEAQTPVPGEASALVTPDANAALSAVKSAPAASGSSAVGSAAILEQVKVQLVPHRPAIVVRLDPPELGRLDMRLRVSGSGLRAQIRVERPEVLRMLDADLSSLVRTLDEAGLKVSSIDLRSADGAEVGADPAGDERNTAGERRERDNDGRGERSEEATTTVSTRPRGRGRDRLIDLTV